MSAVTLTPNDLCTYLGAPVEDNRAIMLLKLAWELCESVVEPLPAAGTAVVLDVVARAYSNPTNLQQETVGPYSTGHGAVSGGLWLTRGNRATLRRLSGGGGAFTIETCPETAGQNLPWWDVDLAPAGDFDTIP